MVLRAGTYVTGIPAEAERGTGIAASVSAEPPKLARSTPTTRWSAAPSDRATCAAAASSDRWRWP
jgi:hypothetical protein